METMNIRQLINAVHELSISIGEARSLCYSGKIIQTDRKLQGSQKKCDNILVYLSDLDSQDKNNVVAQEDTEQTS